MFTVKFNTANEAFEEPATEIARILRAIANKVEAGIDIGDAKPIADINGNIIGQFKWKE